MLQLEPLPVCLNGPLPHSAFGRAYSSRNMATAEVTLQESTPGRGRRLLRFFFVAMAALAMTVVLLAFVPEFRRFAAGTFPIAPVLHIHAAMMAAWVGAFALQAYLGASGQIALHRQVGPYAVAIAGIAWLSMIFVEVRALMVHPIPQDLRELDWMLPGPLVYLTVPIFLVWAIRERRRPEWHKRLMTFALFVGLLAPIERFLWIPADKGFLPFLGALDLCLLAPMVSYDLYTRSGRLHAATVRAMFVLIAGEAILFGLWGTDQWHQFASVVAHRVHG